MDFDGGCPPTLSAGGGPSAGGMAADASTASLAEADESTFAEYPALVDALTCSICTYDGVQLYSICASGHTLCKPCYETARAARQSCPWRCGPLLDVPVQQRFCTEMLTSLTGPCKFAGCAQKMNLMALKDHIKVCSYRPVKCKHVECTWEGPARELDDHLRNSDHTWILTTSINSLTEANKLLHSQLQSLAEAQGSTAEQLRLLRTEVSDLKQARVYQGDSKRTKQRHRSEKKETDALIQSQQEELREMRELLQNKDEAMALLKRRRLSEEEE